MQIRHNPLITSSCDLLVTNPLETQRRANAMPATNSKGKLAVKPKSRDTRIEPDDDNPNDENNNASSAGLPGANHHPYGEDNYEGYDYDSQSQRLRIPLRQTWKSYLLTAFLAFITVLLGLGLLILIIADSYAAPAISRLNLLLQSPTSVQMKFLENALILGGPESVSVDSFRRRDSEGDSERNGLEVNVTVAVRLGVDTDYVMGFPEINTGHRRLDRLWMKTVRWGVSQLGAVTAHVDQLEISSLNSGDHNRGSSLITIRPTSLIPIPLCPNLRAHSSRRSPITDHCNPPLLHLPVSIYPSDNATDVIAFLENNWKDGWLKVLVDVSGVTFVGGAPPEQHDSDPDGFHPAWDERPKWWQFSKWRRWIRVYRSSVETRVELQVSPLKFPDMPPIVPGSELPDIADLLVLESFVASTSATPQPMSLPTDFIPSDSLASNPNNLQHILSTYNHEHSEFLDGHSHFLHDAEQVTLNRENIVILAQASLKHPLGDLAELLDLGIQASAIPFIVSLPVPPAGDNGDGGDNGNSSFVTGEPALTTAQSSTSLPVVKVFTSPIFNETHIRLPIWGYVLPFPGSDSQGNSSSNNDFTSNPIPASSTTTTIQDFTRAVSIFIRSYLSYEPAPILLTTPFYPSLEVVAGFPPPEQKIQIIRDVRLENMWIKPGSIFGINTKSSPKENIKEVVSGVMGRFAGHGGRETLHVQNHAVHSEVAGAERENMENIDDAWTPFALEVLASATVYGRVVLPPGFDIDLEVTRLWVDALIFDGDVPAEDEGGNDEIEVDASKTVSGIASDPPLPTSFPLPTPLPPRAFARITPKTWLNATSSLTGPGEKAEDEDEDETAGGDGGDDEGKSVYVTAEAVDVPLQVLPGRQADLRRFVTKVLFSTDPVIAGIKGVVAVAVKIPGLTVQTELEPASATAGGRHTPHHKRSPSNSFISALDLSSDPNLDSRKPELDPRIEGSELILTDLPFEGKVPIGGSRAWIS